MLFFNLLPQAPDSLNCERERRIAKSTDTTWAFPNRLRTPADGDFAFEAVPVGVSLELAVEIPGVAAGRRCTMIGELVADQDYDMAEVVVNRPPQAYFNERP